MIRAIHCLVLALILVLVIMTSRNGWTIEPSERPTDPVHITRRALHQCVKDARAIDACGRRNVELQRELDAAAGREQVLVADVAKKDDQIASLLRRPTWGQALTLFAVGLSAGLCTSAARGDERTRVPCGVSSAATVALGLVLWRW